MADLKLLFLQILVILLVSRFVAALFRVIGQPEVLGEITAGILLGGSVLGRVAPEIMHGLFPPGTDGGLYVLSQTGLVLFVFLIGLQFDWSHIAGSAGSVAAASLASFGAPFTLGAVLAWQSYGVLPQGGAKLPWVLFIGTAMSITAMPVLARILADHGLLKSRSGTIALSCAAATDLMAWYLLAVIAAMVQPPGGSAMNLGVRFVLLAAYIAVMWLVVRPLLKWILRGNAITGVLVVLLASALAAEALSVHALFGAFLAGAVMPRDPDLEATLKVRIEPLTRALLLPLFFAYTGLRTDIGLVNTPLLWAYCIAIIVLATAGKTAATAVVLRLGKLNWRESLAVGALVNTRGLVELVVLNIGLDLGVISKPVFSMMLLMAIATTLMTAPLLAWINPPASPSGPGA